AFGGFGRTDADTRYFSQPYAANPADASDADRAFAGERAQTDQYLPVYLVNRAAQVWVRED
ncbi:MAG: hypothetical protein K2F84_01900, partial [Bacteroidales bacterium]|nr:hypothetical protein [Bacteroidales bacterium]